MKTWIAPESGYHVATPMPALVRPVVVLLVLAATLGAQPTAQQEPQPPPPPTLTFRGRTDFVRVDVVVTGNTGYTELTGRPVTDLTEADFELYEDGKRQHIEQFKVVRLERAPEEEPHPIESHSQVEQEAARDDVRMFAIVLSRAIRCPDAVKVREALEGFLRTHLFPSDLVAIVDGDALQHFVFLSPNRLRTSDLGFTRDRDELVWQLRRLANPLVDRGSRPTGAEIYARAQGACRTAGVSPRLLEEIAIKLTELREERKSIVYVGGSLGGSQLTLEFHELITTLNRTNTAMYVVDTMGLTAREGGGISGGVGLPAVGPVTGSAGQSSSPIRSNFGRTINLRAIAEATGGLDIVNTNNWGGNLKAVASDASFYYLLGYTSPAPNDGKFHDVDVRVRRPAVTVRSRAGYLALEPQPMRSPFPKAPDVAARVQAALTTIDPVTTRGRLFEAWVGTGPSDEGHAMVTLVWDPVEAAGESRSRAAYVSVVAEDSASTTVFRNPDEGRPPALQLGSGLRGVRFRAAPGRLKVRVSIANRDGDVLDGELLSVHVPNFAAESTTTSPPQVLRARNAREFRMMAEDPDALPVATRQFSRMDHLLIRFAHPDRSAPANGSLLNALGQVMREIPVSPSAVPGTLQLDLPLNGLVPGNYVVALPAAGAGQPALVPLGVR